jgi:hypothetical protein
MLASVVLSMRIPSAILVAVVVVLALPAGGIGSGRGLRRRGAGFRRTVSAHGPSINHRLR